MSTPYAIGIDFGGTSVNLARVLPDGAIAARASFATAGLDGVDGWLAAVADTLSTLCPGGLADPDFAAVGVGVPGFVDFDRGFVHDLTNVPGWTAVPLADRLSALLHRPAVVENDVNAMTAGECAAGAGRTYRHAIFLTLGTGVGGGVLINGSLYRGAHSMAGEIGHVSIDMNGIASPMGRGGVEQYVGNRRLVERALAAIDAGRASSILSLANGDRAAVTPKTISQAAAAGDALALEIFDFAADCLATMMASCAYLLQPEAFIVGGGVSAAGPILFDPLRKHLSERLTPHFYDRLKIVPAALGNDAGMIGCGLLALRKADILPD